MGGGDDVRVGGGDDGGEEVGCVAVTVSTGGVAVGRATGALSPFSSATSGEEEKHTSKWMSSGR